MQISKEKIKNSPMLKLGVIGILILLLQIPLYQIGSIINERSRLKSSVEIEVSEKWGGEQSICGPVLSIPVLVNQKINDEEWIQTREYYHVLPDQLDITGNLEPQTRKRTLYEVLLYDSQLKLNGNWKSINPVAITGVIEKVLWDQCEINIGISDLTGVKKKVGISLNGTPIEVKSGITDASSIREGVSAIVDLTDQAESIHFNIDLHLQGSKSITAHPLGKTTDMKLSSPWDSPSSIGNFLPDEFNISDAGFDAQWTVLDLNRNFPQSWWGSKNIASSPFGVALVQPVDEYKKNERAIKYALLFIGLIFIAYFFSEYLQEQSVNPIQYIMVGAAICVFYLLLISITEHLGFNNAYFIATAACGSIISLYTQSIIKNKRLSILISIGLAFIFGYIYIILQLESYALLVGSIGLFVILAVLMYISRKIDFNNPRGTKQMIVGLEKETATAAAA